MQSNHNNSNENNKNINENEIDVLLLKNQEILNQLILENVNRKEKSLISANEYEYLKKYEKNLIKLIEMCPVTTFNKILAEIDGKILKGKEDEKINNNDSQ